MTEIHLILQQLDMITGQIGYALVPMIARGLMLGPDQPVILHMLDIPPAAEALNGVKMELIDAALPLLKGMLHFRQKFCLKTFYSYICHWFHRYCSYNRHGRSLHWCKHSCYGWRISEKGGNGEERCDVEKRLHLQSSSFGSREACWS